MGEERPTRHCELQNRIDWVMACLTCEHDPDGRNPDEIRHVVDNVKHLAQQGCHIYHEAMRMDVRPGNFSRKDGR